MINCDADRRWMKRALALARRGMGRASPNPCVGAVLVRQGRVIGEGWHRAAGGPHAEIEVFQDARRRGLSPRGATLYVTLEPCCTWGRTPPCTEAILAKGIRRVVAGATDPNPLHSGRGFVRLRRAGVKVIEGMMGEECVALNRAWNHWIARGTPWVIAKCGMTLDGKIATARGESRWITSPQARRDAHRLRARADAILVGINTVLKDDPRLTARATGVLRRQPLRVILDTHARTPLHARVLRHAGRLNCPLDRSGRAQGVWIMVGPDAPAKRVRRLTEAGAKVVHVPAGKDGVKLSAALRCLGKANVVTLLVEGGGTVLGAFFRENRFHEVVFYIAPTVLGGAGSVKAVAGRGFSRWKKSLVLEEMRLSHKGPDLKVTGWVGKIAERAIATTRFTVQRFSGSRVGKAA